jgi:hypothetical protein
LQAWFPSARQRRPAGYANLGGPQQLRTEPKSRLIDHTDMTWLRPLVVRLDEGLVLAGIKPLAARLDRADAHTSQKRKRICAESYAKSPAPSLLRHY